MGKVLELKRGKQLQHNMILQAKSLSDGARQGATQITEQGCLVFLRLMLFLGVALCQKASLYGTHELDG